MHDQVGDHFSNDMNAENEFAPLLQSEAKTGEIYKIFIPNLIFSILTLGLFRFWAKTRMRRYVFSKLKVLGDPFEYTGTGGELFKGFLIVFFLIIVPFGIAPAIYVQVIAVSDPVQVAVVQSLQATFFFLLFPVAIYRAYKYMASRIAWRGVNFALVGKTFGYWWRYLMYMVLMSLTLGLIYPKMQVSLMSYVLNNMRFGSQRFEVEASSKKLYGVFIIAFVCILLITGLSVAIVIAGFEIVSSQYGGSFDELPAGAQFILGEAMVFAGFFWFFGTSIAFSFYNAKFYNHIVSSLKLGACRFKLEIRALHLLWFVMANMLILTLTLGLGYPLVVRRYMTFIVNHVQAADVQSLEQTIQVDRDRLSTGEGLADALDIGAF